MSRITSKDLEKLYKAETSHPEFNRGRWVTLEEAHLLYMVGKEEAPDCIFESGTANGYSTLWLSLVGCPVVTFDPVARPKVWDVLGSIPDNVSYVKDSFSSVVERYKDVGGKRVFFIDGDHSSSGIQKDCEALKEYANRGDVVLFHDLTERPVLRAWMRMAPYALESMSYPTRRCVGRMVWGGKT